MITYRNPACGDLGGVLLRALGARFALLQHHRDTMAWEQLFAGLQGLGLISSKHRHHRDALGQVNNHIEQSAHKGVVPLIVDLKVRNPTPANDWHQCLGLRI